jgi:hypothetical protein
VVQASDEGCSILFIYVSTCFYRAVVDENKRGGLVKNGSSIIASGEHSVWIYKQT